jgi:phosphoribosylaminoimidazolecarboxamide formyltransferase/IMP cyclohydrolase/phosphoribosylaminoimidazolecarboxamide formyltransferase
MSELTLKYGLNPQQKPASLRAKQGELPLQVLNGTPGYINLLDALNAWQLVRELRAVTGLPAATSFKHVSPAGAALGLPLTDTLRRSLFAEGFELSPLAAAYVRARGADRVSSYGDFIALSDVCDRETAAFIAGEVSDGIIAPGYEAEALNLLKTKRSGRYTILQVDVTYTPAKVESRDVFGLELSQGCNDIAISDALLHDIPTKAKELPTEAVRDLLVALVTLKYTQSNSVCYAKGGQAIGIGAGQQSRIHCTRLAGGKADAWHLRQHPRVLALPFRSDLRRPDRDNAIDVYLGEDDFELLAAGNWETFFTERPARLTAEEKHAYLAQISGVALASDAFFPFGDNIERAQKSGARYIAQPGGSIRDDHVIAVCDKYGIVMAMTGIRLFHH